MVIYYDKYARMLCDRENDYCETTGKLDEKLTKMIDKIFQWDRELNLLP